LIFKKGNKIEAVSYWIRLGNSFPMSGLQMRLKILREGLKGKIDDGVLVRVSTLIEDESEAPAAYELQEKFLADLLADVQEVSPDLLVSTLKVEL
ncbi:MAG: exosortase C-terminal domain/associated protein EpsI, partial [Methylococcales bacterium]